MGKSILMSVQPKWVAKILNGEKTIEIRKRFPKDYVGWVYIYCTKSSNCCLLSKIEDNGGLTENGTYKEYQTYEYYKNHCGYFHSGYSWKLMTEKEFELVKKVVEKYGKIN